MSNEEYKLDPEVEAILNGTAPIQMQQTTDLRIIGWNRQRNGLALDMNLELMMLQEEAREFFTADSLVERLQEYSDFVFVYSGTCAKYYAAKCGTVEQFRQNYEAFAELQAWARDFLEYSSQMLGGELVTIVKDEESISSIINRSIKAVVRANEAKGTEKDENGKVVKGPNYVHPRDQIQAILKEYTGKTIQ